VHPKAKLMDCRSEASSEHLTAIYLDSGLVDARVIVTV